MSVRRGSPNFFFISSSSSTMIAFSFSSSASISLRRLISFLSSLCSVLTFSLSRPVSFCSLISRMAWACASLSLNFFIRPSLASFTVRDFLMRAMTSSSLPRAMSSPSRIWALFSALSRSNRVRRVTTSTW